MLINDYFGQNIPFLQFLFQGGTLEAGGALRQLCGKGSFFMLVDFYNPMLSVWEPILEKWRLESELVSNAEEMGLVISSPHTMQLTATGMMLEKVLATYSLLQHDAGHSTGFMAEISVRNLLGTGIDVKLVDSFTNYALASLSGEVTEPVPLFFDRTGVDEGRRNSRLPTMVNAHFGGVLEGERHPLLQLPLQCVAPRMYTLQLTPAHLNAVDVEYDPITVEYFENQRYDPLTRQWRAPFVPMDPPFESDVHGKGVNVPFLSNCGDFWFWLGGWIIDMRGDDRNEVDRDGYEYGTSFKSLCVERPFQRRKKQPMDCVRRRKLFRTKIHTNGEDFSINRTLTIFWNVEHTSNGTRLVTIRSGIQFTNQLPYAVMLSVSRNAFEVASEFGPIEAGATFSLPLVCSSTYLSRIRSVGCNSSWSTPFTSALLPTDYKTKFDIECVSTEDKEIFYLQAYAMQSGKSLTIILSAYIEVHNRLPCAMRYRCEADNGSSEEGYLRSGCSVKLVHTNLRPGARLAIQAGSLGWSEAVEIDSQGLSDCTIELPGAMDLRTGLKLCLECAEEINRKSISLVVYSKGALVDRSGLYISIR